MTDGSRRSTSTEGLALAERPPRHSGSGALRDEILDLIPALRAFARSLTRDAAEADDLLQETLLKALASIHQFQKGTNLRAWLFTIERNTFYTKYRKRQREAPAPFDEMNGPRAQPEQYWSVKMKALHTAVQKLPPDQREALMLVGGAGMSYEEAAEICDCALGTIKSRVSRARCRVLELLDCESYEDFLMDQENWH